MLKKIILFGLAACVVVTVSSCKSSQKANGNSSNSEKTTIKLFANLMPADPSPGDKAFFDACEKATGVKIEFDVPPSTSYAERLQLTLAAGDYPDAIQFLNTGDQTFLNAVSQQVLIPVNKYIKDAENIQKYTYDISWDVLKTNMTEDIYGIPRSSMTRYDGFIIREDWLNNVGLSMPSDNAVTIEEFSEILKRFSENDPDGNGKKDTYGFISCQDDRKRMNPVLLAPFGCNGWQKYDNESYSYMNPVYSKKNENYKNALKYTQDLFKKGYIDPNSPINSSNDMLDKFYKGTVGGVVTEFSGHLLACEQNLKANIPSGKVNYIYVKDSNGEVKGCGDSTGFWGFWSITANCKKPKAVVRVLDWMLSDEGWKIVLNGTEGIDFTVQDGKRVYDEKAKGVWKNNLMRRKGDFDFFTNSIKWTDEENQRVKPIVDIATKGMIFSESRGFTPAIAKSIDYINYSKRMDIIVSKICTGLANISDYDKALDGWYQNGGETYVEQMNDYIEKINSQKNKD